MSWIGEPLPEAKEAHLRINTEIFDAPSPILARWFAPPGPAIGGLYESNGARVAAVPGRYSVTYLIFHGSAVGIVDVGSIGDHKLILAALDACGCSPGQIRYILPTHLHFDHIMGIDGLACDLHVPVALGRVAHRHVVQGEPLHWCSAHHIPRGIVTWVLQGLPFPPLEDFQHGLGFGFPWARDRFQAKLGPILDHGSNLPDLEGWTVLATPGHADDAICLYHEKAGFLVAGDTVRNFLGGEWNPILASHEDYARTRSLLMSLDVQTVFPAHGPVLSGPSVLREIRTIPPWLP